MTGVAQYFEQRCAGVLLHPTSLPGAADNGDLGPDAYRFADFLAASGMSIWQILPHGPTHEDLSPYQCLSIHAGNPGWISSTPLIERGWIELSDLDYFKSTHPVDWRKACIRKAHEGFQERATESERNEYQVFLSQHDSWLLEFALYIALRAENDQICWASWPQPVRDREQAAIAAARVRLAKEIEQVRFEQFLFFCQWQELKQYANKNGIAIFGDLPIYVAYDSADVWVCREQFDLDQDGQPISVAGVPPDYFSPTGQRWGNPHYHWQKMVSDGFVWWRQRLRTIIELYDFVRIDHFRGFESYWAIPNGAETAATGSWVKAPGDSLFQVLANEFGSLPFVAEDLGIITPEVTALRTKYGLPGMKVLQFAFDGGPQNPHLPHNHERLSVVYTGTHDNNTTLGWFGALSPEKQALVQTYLGHSQAPMPWPMIRAAMASVANITIIPMQDLLELGADCRMNTPAITKGNWRWRFDWEQIGEGTTGRINELVRMYGRTQANNDN